MGISERETASGVQPAGIGRDVGQGQGGEAPVERAIGLLHRLVQRGGHRPQDQAGRLRDVEGGERDHPLAEGKCDGDGMPAPAVY